MRTEPGRDLVIVMRTARDVDVALRRQAGPSVVRLEIPDALVHIRAEGREVGELRVQPGSGWEEAVLRVPTAALKNPRTRLEFRGRYLSFRYWFFQ